MNPETKYRYEKRIKELEARVHELDSNLRKYKTACSEIHDAVLDTLRDGKVISMPWIVRQFRNFWIG